MDGESISTLSHGTRVGIVEAGFEDAARQEQQDLKAQLVDARAARHVRLGIKEGNDGMRLLQQMPEPRVADDLDGPPAPKVRALVHRISLRGARLLLLRRALLPKAVEGIAHEAERDDRGEQHGERYEDDAGAYER